MEWSWQWWQTNQSWAAHAVRINGQYDAMWQVILACTESFKNSHKLSQLHSVQPFRSDRPCTTECVLKTQTQLLTSTSDVPRHSVQPATTGGTAVVRGWFAVTHAMQLSFGAQVYRLLFCRDVD